MEFTPEFITFSALRINYSVILCNTANTEKQIPNGDAGKPERLLKDQQWTAVDHAALCLYRERLGGLW
jgi:hypothetical protein